MNAFDAMPENSSQLTLPPDRFSSRTQNSHHDYFSLFDEDEPEGSQFFTNSFAQDDVLPEPGNVAASDEPRVNLIFAEPEQQMMQAESVLNEMRSQPRFRKRPRSRSVSSHSRSAARRRIEDVTDEVHQESGTGNDSEDERLASLRNEKREMEEGSSCMNSQNGENSGQDQELWQLFGSQPEEDQEEARQPEMESESEEEEDTALADPEEQEDRVWRGVDRYACRVCKTMSNDPYFNTLVGVLQNEIVNIITERRGTESIETSVHRAVQKNNDLIVRQMRNAGFPVEMISAVDFFKHFGLGCYSTEKPCVIVPEIELEMSLLAARQLENKLARRLMSDTEGLLIFSGFFRATARMMWTASQNKVSLLKSKQQMSLKKMQIEAFRKKNSNGKKMSRIFSNQNTLIEAPNHLGGTSVATMSQPAVSCSSVYKLMQ